MAESMGVVRPRGRPFHSVLGLRMECGSLMNVFIETDLRSRLVNVHRSHLVLVLDLACV